LEIGEKRRIEGKKNRREKGQKDRECSHLLIIGKFTKLGI